MEAWTRSLLTAVLIVGVAIIIGLVQLPQWWVDYATR